MARKDDVAAVGAGILFVLFIIAAITFSIWVRFFASCSDIGWLPIHEMPGRCLTFVNHN